MKTHVNIRRLRLFEQIISFFVLVLIVPLLGMSLLIFNINQNALKKELRGFTEQAAMGMFQDLVTELEWQKRQASLIQRRVTLLLQQTPPDTALSPEAFNQALAGLTAQEIAASSLLSPTGEPLLTRTWQDLPARLDAPKTQQKRPLTASTRVYWQTPETPMVRFILPLKEAPERATSHARWLQLDQPFPKLNELLSRHQQAFEEAVYLVDDTGTIIAGPPALVSSHHQLSPSQMAVFKTLLPGVTGEIRANFPSSITSTDDSSKAVSRGYLHEAEAVVLKLPELNWGLVIQSPYALKQQYIQRARTQSLLLIVAMAIGVALLVAGYVLGLTRNFRQLIKGIIAMAEGNYTRRIRLIANWLTPYEIVYLTGEFNRMARKTAEAWERVQAVNQQLAKLDELKSTLIDTVSHELRTPLTNIKGYTSRLLRLDDTLDPPARQSSLKRIKINADRLSRLVDDLLVIPELEQSGLRMFEDHVPLMPLLDHCVQLMLDRESEQPAKSADKPSLPIEILPVEILPGPKGDSLATLEVLADPDRLTQVLLNLLDNAVKYAETDSGTPITLGVVSLEDHCVHLTVSNPSPLIEAELLPTLFDKFTRLDASTTRTTRGTGLGLYITRSLIEAMGGEISLASDDRGFHVNITLRRAQR